MQYIAHQNTVLIWPQIRLGHCCVYDCLNETKIYESGNKQYKSTAFAYSLGTVVTFWIFNLGLVRIFSEIRHYRAI